MYYDYSYFKCIGELDKCNRQVLHTLKVNKIQRLLMGAKKKQGQKLSIRT